MLASPASYKKQQSAFETVFLSKSNFWRQEKLIKQHDTTLWQAFHTRGKYQDIVAKADWFAIATKTQKYVSSAFVIEVGDKWLLEYVMTDPTKQNRGAGSSVMNRIMSEAKRRKIKWVLLNCDDRKNRNQLPNFYATFGFRKVG